LHPTTAPERSAKLQKSVSGGLNCCYKLRFDEDGKEWLLCFPMPGSCMNPTLKVKNETAVMRFIKEKTPIPVPELIASGFAEGSFSQLGPYILIEWVNGTVLSDLVLDPDDANWRLRQDLDKSISQHIYRQIAQIYLELFNHDFSTIGSLSTDEEESERIWSVSAGPLTH
jgi:aminoglycoside phosphotransferase (APT) family kinase protein